MAFPQTPRAVKVDLYLNNGWVDVTNDVYVRDGIVINRGTADENTAPQPSTCTLTFNNRSGNYSPRNPNSIYYGSLGRNTPIRVGIEQVTDTFTRTVSNGWGSADTGQAWTSISTGTFTASDFNVSGGVGTHSVSAAGGFRYNYLAANSYKDVDVAVKFTVPITTITGASIFPATVLLRWQSLTSYYMVIPEITTAGHIFLSIYQADGSPSGIQLAAGVDTGIIHSSSQAIQVRAQAEGRVIRAKAWIAANAEPFSWTVSASNDSIVQGGPVAIRSTVGTGNTNTLPLVFSYDNITVRSPRFSGEVSAWPQRWDLSGNDVWAPAEAAGPRRRLGQSGGGSASSSGGAVAPIRSAMRRFWTQNASNVIAYWPMEDGKESLLIASGLRNALPMTVFTVATKGQRFDFAGYDALASSAALPVLGNAWLAGTIPMYTSSNTLRISWFMHAPSSPLPDATVIGQIYFSGTLLAIQITFRNADGSISLEGFNRSGTTTGVLSTGPVSFGLVDTSQFCSLDLTQNGANIDWGFRTTFLGDTIFAFVNGTITGFTFGKVVVVGFDPYLECKDTAVGHCVVRTATGDPPGSVAAFNAWSGDPLTVGGETMGQRVDRLSVENSLTVGGKGSRSNTQQAGPQRVDTLLNLLDSMASSDFGILSEMKGDTGLAFRTRASMYNQTAALTLNYSSGQVSPPFEPTDDDQQTRNDVIVARDGGANAEAQISSGRMSVSSPDQGGVGIYSTQVTISVAYDSQLASCATWLASLGTVNETRYPVVTVEIANSNVTALDSAILDVDIGDRLTISNPKTGQTPDQITQIVRGYTERIEPYTHTIGFNCSPESPYEVIRLDSGYKIDSGTSTLVSGVTSSATTLSVATTGTLLWTTSGSFPIAIRVAGEIMNVTAISGTSSPQTFTVTRSVNGVIKAQIAGAVVSLAKPSPLAL